MDNLIEHSAQLSGPNSLVLEAQSRVCTGPGQSRPLGRRPGDPDPDEILTIILDSLKGKLPKEEAASRAQIGSFLTAMWLRKAYPPATGLSEAEKAALQKHEDAFRQKDSAIRFLVSADSNFLPGSEADRILVKSLVTILAGDHLTRDETEATLQIVTGVSGDPALKAGVLIGQRMNHENDAEFGGYLDSVYPPDQIKELSTPSLTTIGEPYTGSNRFFKPTCFVAAVRSVWGRPTLLHGVDFAPPKNGITEEQILHALGANTRLTPAAAKGLIENENVGFAYLDQRDFAPNAYRALELRTHIGKRPTWAASEKAQLIFRSAGRNDLVVGYFHSGYEQKQLLSMVERGLTAGCVIKGEEGTSQLSLRAGAPSEGKTKTLNYVEGFRPDKQFSLDIDPTEFGFHYEQSPRPQSVSADTFAQMGYAALSGERGHAFDRIVMNAGLLDWLLGYAPDPQASIESARKVILNGSARKHLDAYVSASQRTAANP